MRRLGLALLAVAFTSQAWSQEFSARRVLDDVRAHAGERAGLPECAGTFDQTCSIGLGRSFVVRTEATNTGELIVLQVVHNEMYRVVDDPVLGPIRRPRHPALFDGTRVDTDDLPCPPLSSPGDETPTS